MTSKEALSNISSMATKVCYFLQDNLPPIEKELEILEEHRKIEKELGIELTILFSALKYGVYYFSYDDQLIHDYVYLISNHMDVGVHEKLSFSFKTFLENQTLLFENYGKTWALDINDLAREELS